MRFKTLLTVSAAPFILAACATAPAYDVADVGSAEVAATDTAEPAELTSLIDEVAIPHEKFTLENGLDVIVHTDRKAPIVGVAVWYNVGSKDEPQGQTGFAHLFEHLMFNGSENAPEDYFQYLQEMGATDYNGTTNFDRTNYFQTVPTAALERALWLESDRMGYLLGAVTQEKLDNQRGVVQNEKRQGDNQPGGLVFYEIIETLFPAPHPYDHSPIGSMADLDAASMEDVRNWFRDKYGPNNATLVLAGDVSPAEGRRLAEKYFGEIERGPVNEPAQAEITELAAPVRTVMRDQVAATNISKYWTAPGITDRELTALTVGAQILGGLSSSRLDNALVRDEQLAVGVSGGNFAFQRVGILNVGATAKPGVETEVLEARLDALIDQFIAEGPTEDEVRRAATSTVAQTIRGLEQVGGFGGKAVTLASGEVLAGDPDFFSRQLETLATLTPAEVQAAMQRWMTRPAMTLVLEPGERDSSYEEAASVAAEAEAADAATAEEITVTKERPAPPITASADLDFPDVQHTTLANGMTLHYAMRDAVPATYVTMSFNAGSAADPISKRGLETLALSLFDEGTTTRTSQELAEARERLGANISLGGGADRSTFTLSALSANLVPSLELMSDVVRNPAFDPSEIERVRTQQITGVQQELRTPASIAARTLTPLIYGEQNPYGGAASGTVESLQSITREDIVTFKEQWIRPDNGEVFVVSDRPLAEIVGALNTVFGDWDAPAVAKGVKSFSNMPERPEEARVVLVNRPNSPQSYILGGQITPVDARDETYVDFLNANNALGGNFLARLNMNLRETKGWSYGVRGAPQTNENAVAYRISAPVQADRTGDALAELIRETGEFLDTRGVTEAELTRIVAAQIGELPGQFETSGAVLSAMQNNALYGRPDNYYELLADRYRAQTGASLDAAARAAIDPDRFVWVVVGDAEQVEPQLESLGLDVEVVEMAQTGN
ncbi:M16 family metallopeptidase [Qipengyuania huizhouensis]|uniref:M16 family metallopeptidase n=1 Tax=Qipengyuania huizhouensis TaxID=2867245 RepID=UPI001C887A1C|nr:pitrilysin family protein [Qipengyuania huizhouensis]MBX7459463.1 insulinase family protein [Qipengyuania huizhouensis]